MIPIDLAVRGSKKLEGLLERRFGATGRGLHEKLSSVETRVPADVGRTIRWIATIRNKVVHEEGTVGASAEEFQDAVDRVLEGLEPGSAPPPTSPTAREPAGGKAARKIALAKRPAKARSPRGKAASAPAKARSTRAKARATGKPAPRTGKAKGKATRRGGGVRPSPGRATPAPASATRWLARGFYALLLVALLWLAARFVG